MERTPEKLWLSNWSPQYFNYKDNKKFKKGFFYASKGLFMGCGQQAWGVGRHILDPSWEGGGGGQRITLIMGEGGCLHTMTHAFRNLSIWMPKLAKPYWGL